MKNEHYYIDIFAGCGGLSAGLLEAGWTGLFAIEKNSDAFSTLNYNLIQGSKHFSWPDWLPRKECDINILLKNYEKELLRLQGNVTLVAGGPPCQGFSTAGKRDRNDQRNKLVKSYIKFIKLVMPKVIIFENVHGFTVHFKGKRGTKQYSSYVEGALKRLGYKVAHQMVNMSEYGVPQNRKRFILVAMREHSPKDVFSQLEMNRNSFCHSKGISCSTNVDEAIGDLKKTCGTISSPDTRGFQAGIYGIAQSGYQRLMRKGVVDEDSAVDSHRFVNHRKEIVRLQEELLQKAPRGKRVTPDDNIVGNLKRRGVTVLDASAKTPTITTIPDELVHYEEARILTVREHARIQSFPDWFQFKGKYTSGGQRRKLEVPRYTQVGNAVPPLFAEQIGLAILEVLSHEQKQ